LLEILKLPNVIMDFKGRWIGLQAEPWNNNIHLLHSIEWIARTRRIKREWQSDYGLWIGRNLEGRSGSGERLHQHLLGCLEGTGKTAVSRDVARIQTGYLSNVSHIHCHRVIPISRGNRQYVLAWLRALTAMTVKSTVFQDVAPCSSGKNSLCNPEDCTLNKY
jgi:hypothetical protein